MIWLTKKSVRFPITSMNGYSRWGRALVGQDKMVPYLFSHSLTPVREKVKFYLSTHTSI